MTMGERITALRKGRGMTQEQLAEKLSVTRQSVSKWELDQSIPDMSYAVALCKLFEISLDYLVQGKEAEAVPLSAAPVPADTTEQTGEEEAVPKSDPLFPGGYVGLFGILILIAVEIFLHFLAFSNLWGFGAAEYIIALLPAIILPLPALYLATRRWRYGSRRQAFRHIWQVSVPVSVVTNLLVFGEVGLYLSVRGDAFWIVDWELLCYQFQVAAFISLAVLVPLLIRFHHKPILCWLFYFLSWGIFGGGIYIQDLLTLPIRLPIYWHLASTGIRFLLAGLILLSQIIVYVCLPKDDVQDSPPPIVSASRFIPGCVTVCTLAIPAFLSGLYYDLGFSGLPTEYLPLLFPPCVCCLALFFHRNSGLSVRGMWGMAVKTICVALPLMLASHIGVGYFIQYLLSYGGPMPDLHLTSYLLVSLLSAVCGGILFVPPMIILRRRAWVCAAVLGIATAAVVLATIFLPIMFY